MRLLVLAFMFLSFSAFGQSTAEKEKKDKVQVVEAGCGHCLMGLKSESCALAVKIDGKAYFVDGVKSVSLDDDGLCEASKKAEVKGKVVDGRFTANHFKLLAVKEEENK